MTLSEQDRQQILQVLTGELRLAADGLVEKGFTQEQIAEHLRRRSEVVRSMIPADDRQDRVHDPVNNREIVQEG